MWVFHPAIWKGSVLTALPRPVTSLRIADSWDFEKFKTPLADGDQVTGHSRNGVDVQVEGQFGARAGIVTIDEAAMLQAVVDLRTLLDVNGAPDRFGLVLYHNPSTGQSRLFEKCTAVRFESDLSDPSLFTYSLLVHASSPDLVTRVLS